MDRKWEGEVMNRGHCMREDVRQESNDQFTRHTTNSVHEVGANMEVRILRPSDRGHH
jgi:hypothetical protein